MAKRKIKTSQSAPKVSEKSRSGNLLPAIPRPLPLVAQVELILRSAIRSKLFPNGQFPTLHELSEQLSVSRETIRLAIKSLEREGMIVKRTQGGIHVYELTMHVQASTPPYNVLGYLEEAYDREGEDAETVGQPQSGILLEGAIIEAGQHNYQVIARNAKPFQLHDTLDEMKTLGPMDGIIFACVSDEKFLRNLCGQGLPTVLVDHDLYLPKVSSIRSNSEQNAELAVQHLVQLGHKRIVCANWWQSYVNPWFIQGYRLAMRAARLQRCNSWEIEAKLSQIGASETLERVLSLSPRPTAMICFHNTFASQIIAEARQRGLRVPGDLSVIGGGGERVTDLTCTRLDWRQLGSKGVRMLLKTMAGGEQHIPEHLLFPYKLYVGNTTAAITEG